MSRIRRIISNIQPTRKAGYKSSIRQYAEMLWMGAYWHLSPIEYRSYEFGRRDMGRKEMKEFLRIHDAEKKLRPTLNAPEWAPLLENKLLFNSFYSQRGLPVPQLYGMFHPVYGSDMEANPLRNENELQAWVERNKITHFVAKPLAGATGTSVLVLEKKEQADILFVDRGGQEYNLSALVKHMSQKVNYSHQGFLLEEQIVGHPDLTRFNPSSVNTCRVVTLLNHAGDAEVALAVLRIGGEGRNTDNWHTEGIAAGIDIETGIIGQGVVRPEFGGTRHSRHPETGVIFEGEKIPQWDKIVQLALKAARVTPFIHTVGWDVAATPQGPVIIEANYNWGPVMVQSSQGGMLTPELRQELREFDLEFPE